MCGLDFSQVNPIEKNGGMMLDREVFLMESGKNLLNE